MISFREATLLYGLAQGVREGCIVEVGSYRGRSTVALGRGSIDGGGAPVYAIEPHEPFTGVLGGRFGPEDRGAFYEAMLRTGCCRAVRLVNLSTERVVGAWEKPVALLWIDGDHTYEGVRRDFDCWAPHLTATAQVAFDDATNPKLGPHRLIRELIEGGSFRQTAAVGKVVVLSRCGAPPGGSSTPDGTDHADPARDAAGGTSRRT